MKKYNQLTDIEQYKIKNHIGNLFYLSTVDGKFSKSEGEVILKICDRYGINRQEIYEMLKDSDGKIQSIIPSDTMERLEQIFDFITIIVADGSINIKELMICKQLAGLLHINKKNLNNLILTIVEQIEEGKTFEDVKLELYHLVNE
jgi:uncharacterized tellurite resistance protein B-like protein